MSTDKILIEIFKLYGSGDEVSQKTINFVIDSIDKLEEALNDKGFGMLYEIGGSEYDDFVNGNSSNSIIECEGDWDDPVAYKLVRYSYEEKMKELEETYKNQKDEINSLFRI